MNVSAEQPENDEPLDQLLAAALAGDEVSRSQIIDSCRAYLLAIAQSNLDDQLRAKLGSSDIVQETCMKANAAFNQFRGRTYPELLAWMRQTLVNDLVDVRRKYRAAQVRDVARESPLDAGTGTASPHNLVDPMLTPSSAADMQEQIDALRSALNHLSDEYRQVIIWRNWDRLSFAEIGERLNRSEDAARKLWSRAVAKLADYLPE